MFLQIVPGRMNDSTLLAICYMLRGVTVLAVFTKLHFYKNQVIVIAHDKVNFSAFTEVVSIKQRQTLC